MFTEKLDKNTVSLSFIGNTVLELKAYIGQESEDPKISESPQLQSKRVNIKLGI